MNIIQSAMEFSGYCVRKAVFSTNELLRSEETEFELTPTFTRLIQQNDDEKYTLVLGVSIGSEQEGCSFPFNLEVAIEGSFILKGIDEPDKAMRINAVAILFPYLRSTVSIFTTLMNVNPVVLPTINLVAMFDSDNDV